MRIITLLILTVCCSMFSHADRYKILSMNYPTLHVNGKAAKVGDVFDDNATVKWSKERQAMRVYNIDKKKQILMVAHAVDPKGSSISDILTANKHLSTHNAYTGIAESNELRNLQHMFDNQYDVLDEVEIESVVPLSDKQYFQATYYYGDTRIIKKLNSKDGKVVIDKSIFDIDKKKLEPRDVEIDIDYFDEVNKMVTFVTAGVELYIVPDKIK